MPELAEVEYFRRRWDCGLGQSVRAVELHGDKRLFRGTDVKRLLKILPGSKLMSSEARGKQMAFRFSDGVWLGLHLGMTGRLSSEKPGFAPGKHDHLVLYQRKQALVFTDMRVFGRALFYQGDGEPKWWSNLPPALTSNAFTVEVMESFLRRHAKAPIKAVLLLQSGFPGVGNWMADEILWRAKIHPRTPAGRIGGPDARSLCRCVRWVCENALRTMANDYSDPPASWLFPHRWEKSGRCPRDGQFLERATIGGRTTAWCPKCQKS